MEDKLLISKAESVDKLLISREELVDKLKHLKYILQGEPVQTYEFAEYVASTINPQGDLSPAGVNIAFELALSYLKKGEDATGKPVPVNLRGLQPMLLSAFSSFTTLIVKAVCPDDFAKEYEVIWKKTH